MDAFTYTNHAVDRFKERFPHLQVKGQSPLVTFHRVFTGAKLDRSFLNDTKRLVYMMEKYGDYDQNYYVNGDIVFVTKQRTVITVMDRHDGYMKKLFGDKTQGRFRRSA